MYCQITSEDFKLFFLFLLSWSFEVIPHQQGEFLPLWVVANFTEVSCDSGIKRNRMCTVILLTNRRILLYKVMVLLIHCRLHSLGENSPSLRWEGSKESLQCFFIPPLASIPHCFCGCCELPSRFGKFISFSGEYSHICNSACFGASSGVGGCCGWSQGHWISTLLSVCPWRVTNAPCAWRGPDLTHFLPVGSAHSPRGFGLVEGRPRLKCNLSSPTPLGYVKTPFYAVLFSWEKGHLPFILFFFFF